MSKITYTDKVALNENPNVADINKVKADDLNEIKNVVNANDNNVGDLADLKTDDVSNIVNAVNEVFDNSHYMIEKKGDYIYKKYDNGLVEIYQKSQMIVQLTNDYNPSTAHWANVDCTLPEPIKELYSINTTIGQDDANTLLGWCYRFVPNESEYKLFVYDLGLSRSKQIYIYTTIVGRWK